MAFKRKYSGTVLRNVKRRIFSKRFKKSSVYNRKRFGKRGFQAISAQLGNYVQPKYRSRKLSSSSWRRNLLASTRFKPHYRSIATVSSIASTPTNVTQATKVNLIPLKHIVGGANYFWTAGGGCQQIDAGVAVPSFSNSSIMLRGGRASMSIGNNSTVDSVRLRIWLLWTRAGSDKGGFNAVTTVPTQWDPTVWPDFYESFKLVQSWEHILLPASRPFEIIKMLKAQKIDFDAYQGDDWELCFTFTIAQCTDIDTPTASSVTYVTSYSLSFCGDLT